MTNLITHVNLKVSSIQKFIQDYVLFEIFENYSTSYFGNIIQG